MQRSSVSLLLLIAYLWFAVAARFVSDVPLPPRTTPSHPGSPILFNAILHATGKLVPNGAATYQFWWKAGATMAHTSSLIVDLNNASWVTVFGKLSEAIPSRKAVAELSKQLQRPLFRHRKLSLSFPSNCKGRYSLGKRSLSFPCKRECCRWYFHLANYRLGC
jgi:hypothetical protein